jgi:hypothetical protein
VHQLLKQVASHVVLDRVAMSRRFLVKRGRHRVPYRSLGRTRSTRGLPNPSPSAAIYATRRLSQPSRKEAEEAGSDLDESRHPIGR